MKVVTQFWVRSTVLFFCAHAIVLVALSGNVKAEQTTKIPVIGTLRPGSPPDVLVETFVQGMRDLGYKEEQNVRIEYRWGRGIARRMRELAAELVALNVDVIFAPDTLGVEAAKSVTTTIPIVFAAAGDPVGSGFVRTSA